MTIFRRLKNIPDIKKYKKINKILIERDFALIFFEIRLLIYQDYKKNIDIK